jgi:alkanesulfonate monooxygenase SsuD/methylene tetrahydromethanopterin reductase-like flavin-dependent oxidoreductase (luciferase family)
LQEPYFMLAAGVAAADTDAEAMYLRSSQVLAFARLRSGRPGKLPPPQHDLSEIPPQVMLGVEEALSCAAVGSLASVTAQLAALIDRHRPDEIILTGMIHDHAARLHSFELAAEAMRSL